MEDPIAQNGDAGDSPPDGRIRINQPSRSHIDGGIKRTSNWWTAAAYNITAIIGLGVLGLPYAMVFLSWGGIVVMALACLITYFTLKQLVELHEVDTGVRYMTYHSLGSRAFGYPLGHWIVLPMQMVVEVSLDVLFTVAVGEAMVRMLVNCDRPEEHQVPIYVWFVVFGGIQVGLSCVLPNYSSIKWIAVAAAIMSTCYSSIAWISLVSVEHPDGGNHRPPDQLFESNLGADLSHVGLNGLERVLQALNGIGVIAFAFAAHNVVLDIQTDLPYPSCKEMMKGVNFTYLVVVLCYFPMAIAIYWVYGSNVSSNALGFMLDRVPKGWVIATNIMLIIHLIGSYQIFAIPVFKLLEVFTKYPPYVVRTTYILTTTLLAIVFPFFSPLLGFFGGAVIAPTTYILPCILWLLIKGNSRRWTREHYINWGCILLGVLIMIVAIAGGISNFIKQIRVYHFYRIFTKSWKHSGFYPNCTLQENMTIGA